MRLSLSWYHTVQTSFLLCIRKKTKIDWKWMHSSTQQNGCLEALIQESNIRSTFLQSKQKKECYSMQDLWFSMKCRSSWLVARTKRLFWLNCYIKIIREVINKYYSNYQILYNADFEIYFGCLYCTCKSIKVRYYGRHMCQLRVLNCYLLCHSFYRLRVMVRSWMG